MKNRKAIYLLFLANIISGMAQGISMLAIPWYFAEVSRTDFFWSFYLIITFITLFWGVYAGTLVDRYCRKKLFIIVNCICGLLVGSIALTGLYSNLEINYSDLLVVSVFAVTICIWSRNYRKKILWKIKFLYRSSGTSNISTCWCICSYSFNRY